MTPVIYIVSLEEDGLLLDFRGEWTPEIVAGTVKGFREKGLAVSNYTVNGQPTQIQVMFNILCGRDS